MEKKMNYYELDVWKKGRSLVTQVYELTKDFPKDEIFGITAQVRRAAVSVPSNIAEGCGRNTSKDTLQFLFIARGSLYELETQILICYDQKFLSKEHCDKIITEITECKKLLNGFINYYQTLKPRN